MKTSLSRKLLRFLTLSLFILVNPLSSEGQRLLRMAKDLNSAGETILEVDKLNTTFQTLKARFSKEKSIYFEINEFPKSDVDLTIEALKSHPKVSGLTTEEVRDGLLVLFVNTKMNLQLMWQELPEEVRQKFELEMDAETSSYFVVDAESDFSKTLSQILDESGNYSVSGNVKDSDEYNSPTQERKILFEPYMSLSDSLMGFCQESKSSEKIQLGISPFFIATKINEPKSYHVERMIAYLNSVSCFEVISEPIKFIPEGTQAIITGEIKDYYTSSNAFGKPRIHLLVSIHSASSMEVIASINIQKEGNAYSGNGFNTQLEELWHACLVEMTEFALANREKLEGLEKVKEEKVMVLKTEHSMQKRIETHNAMEGQIRYNESKLEQAHNRNLGLSEYFNDMEVYNSYPKPAYLEFFEYTVGGKKFNFSEIIGYSDEAAFLSAENLLGGRDGIGIKCDPVTITGDLKIETFDPAFFPASRRFYFGNRDVVDPRVPGSREKVSVTILLMDEKSSTDGNQKNSSLYDLPIYANNHEGNTLNNIEWGYIQILEFETGGYGVIEILFKFKTLEIAHPSGFTVAPTIVEGRTRARGNIKPLLR